VRLDTSPYLKLVGIETADSSFISFIFNPP
jgi:hypothetical protein